MRFGSWYQVNLRKITQKMIKYTFIIVLVFQKFRAAFFAVSTRHRAAQKKIIYMKF